MNDEAVRSLEDERKFFNDLRDQVGAWSQYNFGEQLAHRPLMGMIEELCELEDALGALQRVDVLDAVGDVTIYMADYFYRQIAAGGSKEDWDLGTIWIERSLMESDVLTRNTAARVIQMLAHHHLKGEQNIRQGTSQHYVRVRDACKLLFEYIEYASGMANRDFFDVVSETWSRVSKRDWRKNPGNAHQVLGVVEAVITPGKIDVIFPVTPEAIEAAAAIANLESVRRLEIDTKTEPMATDRLKSYLEECKREDRDPGDVFE